MSLTPIPANLFSGAALRRVGNGSTLELVSRTAVAGTRPSCQGRRIQCSTRRALQPNGAGRGQIWCQQLLPRCSPLDVSQRPPRRANRGRPRSWPRGTRSESRGVPITPCPWRLNHSIRFFISASFRFVTLWFRRGFGRSSVQNPLRQLTESAAEIPEAVRDQHIPPTEVALGLARFLVDPCILSSPWTEERMECVDVCRVSETDRVSSGRIPHTHNSAAWSTFARPA